MRLLLGLLALSLLAGCGTAAPTVTPSPVPFARFTPADVVATFRNAGLRADDPIALGAIAGQASWATFYDQAPLGGCAVSMVLRVPYSLGIYVANCPTASDLDTLWRYEQARPRGTVRSFNSLRNGNLILMATQSAADNHDLNRYYAAFVAMR